VANDRSLTAEDIDVIPTVAGGSDVQAALQGLEAAGLWVPNAIPGVIAGNWIAGNNGTWSDAGGVISQTNPTADSLLESVLPFPSVVFVVEADIRIPSGQDAGTAALALVSAGDQNVLEVTFDGTGEALGQGGIIASSVVGDGGPFVVTANSDGTAAPSVAAGFATAIAQDTWHTLRAVVSGTLQMIYLDGVFVFGVGRVSGGNSADGTTTPPTTISRVHVGAVGLADFRNVTVWTLGLPA
jgi:hypothetical protein